VAWNSGLHEIDKDLIRVLAYKRMTLIIMEFELTRELLE